MIFLEKIAKMGKEGKLGKSGLCRSEGCLAAAKPRAKKVTPRVRCSVAVLRRGERLFTGANFFSDFVPKASYSYTDCLGTLIND